MPAGKDSLAPLKAAGPVARNHGGDSAVPHAGDR